VAPRPYGHRPISGAVNYRFWSACAGNEVRSQASFTLAFVSYGTGVTVYHTLYMYEGTSCDTTDLDGQDSETFDVANYWGGDCDTIANDSADGYWDEVRMSAYVSTKLV
jgi:hypothetical protein